jgi:hypothetical protein
VVYDIDDNHQIDFGDFSFFAAAFGKDAGPPSPTMPYVWWADFDKSPSGKVDFGDLSFFAPNFNKNRAAVQAGDQTLIFPANFPEAWRAGAGGGSGDVGEGEWQTLGNAAPWDRTMDVGEEAGIEPSQAGDRFAAELAGASAETFARSARLPVADRVLAATDGAFAQIGADRTERWTSVKPESARRQLDDLQRHQRPLRLGSRWEPLEDTLSLLAEREPNDARDDICDPLDTLFAKIGK